MSQVTRSRDKKRMRSVNWMMRIEDQDDQVIAVVIWLLFEELRFVHRISGIGDPVFASAALSCYASCIFLAFTMPRFLLTVGYEARRIVVFSWEICSVYLSWDGNTLCLRYDGRRSVCERGKRAGYTMSEGFVLTVAVLPMDGPVIGPQSGEIWVEIWVDSAAMR